VRLLNTAVSSTKRLSRSAKYDHCSASRSAQPVCTCRAHCRVQQTHRQTDYGPMAYTFGQLNMYVYCRHRQLHAIWRKSSMSETQTNELSMPVRLEITPIMQLVLCRLLERNTPESTHGDRLQGRLLIGSYWVTLDFHSCMLNEFNEVTFERTRSSAIAEWLRCVLSVAILPIAT